MIAAQMTAAYLARQEANGRRSAMAVVRKVESDGKLPPEVADRYVALLSEDADRFDELAERCRSGAINYTPLHLSYMLNEARA